ncbi:lysoplasmalogenase [Gordonia caeni]|uniref:Lysoplasmalogenase n=1 Tax=Gordonia caeni TaxID=1007097 RepID=A0ABP7PTM1_9ACTN
MRSRAWPAAAWAPFVVAAVVHVAALIADSALAGPTKLTLMPLLAVPVVVAGPRLRPPAVTALVLVALVFSWLGDGAGALFPGGPELPLMLGFFGLAHLAYIVAFVRFLGTGPWLRWAVLYGCWWVAMVAVIGPHAGGLLVAVAVYGVVLAGTAATGARCGTVIAAGAAFFLASDSLLAFRIFLPDAAPGWFSPAVMATYTLGQGLIVFGVLRAATAGTNRSSLES